MAYNFFQVLRHFNYLKTSAVIIFKSIQYVTAFYTNILHVLGSYHISKSTSKCVIIIEKIRTHISFVIKTSEGIFTFLNGIQIHDPVMVYCRIGWLDTDKYRPNKKNFACQIVTTCVQLF